MAAGAGMGAFVSLVVQLTPPKTGPDMKPYLILNDTEMPYAAVDELRKANDLPAKRSVRVAYECGAKSMTQRLATIHSLAAIIVPAGYDDREVNDCIQGHVNKGEVTFRYYWLTNRELIY